MTDDTYQLLEEVIAGNLAKLTVEGGDDRKDLLNETSILLEKLNTVDQINNDFWNKDKQRELEEKKLEAEQSLEKEKLNLNWKRVLFEFGKILLPSFISIFAYGIFQRRMLKFEETGRITSTAGRELHLPSFMKK